MGGTTMDISAEIDAIQAASQGSELRQPLVDALNILNSGSLPAVTTSDAGKILKVGANGWEVGEKTGYMPVPTATKQITENGSYDVTDFANAQVYVSGGSGGISILSGTGTPSNNIGINGQIYLQYGFVSFSSFLVYKEASMSITPNQNNIVFDYLGGAAIGGQAYKQFDLTDINEISFSITSGHHSYNNYQTDRFAPLVVIENTVNPANNFVANTLPYIPGSRISTNDTTINLTVDVSSYTGNYWIVFCSYGCDSTVDSLSFGNLIMQPYCKVNGVWQNLIGIDISNVNLGT